MPLKNINFFSNKNLDFMVRTLILGGFAWRLVINPNGEDDITRGLISVRLQCATSAQMARCKTRLG